MKHEIQVIDLNIVGSREWGRAFGKVRDAFIAKLKKCLETHAVQDFRDCDASGKQREAHFDDVSGYLSRMINDAIKVAYAVCDEDGQKILWVCVSDELPKKPVWPCPRKNVLFQDAHFGVVAVMRKKRALPVDEKYIKEAERELGVQFPSSYATRMSQANGGQLKIGRREFTLYPVFDKADRKSIRRTAESIVTESPRAISLPRFPANAVAIGSDKHDVDRLVFVKEEGQDSLGSEVYCWTYRTGKLKKVADDIRELE